MRNSSRALLAVALLAVSCGASAQAPPAVDPKATAIARQMRDYLHGLSSFEVRADATMEDVLGQDEKVQVSNRVRYEYRAPDKLFAEWQSDRQLRRLYYDGQRLTMVAPLIGYYATTDMSGNVADVVKRVSERYGIVFPLPDLFLWAWSTDPVQGVTSARDVGYARLAKVDTEQLFFRDKDVDWQMWVERGDKPLPRKIAIVDRSDPVLPGYWAMLQWNPDVQLPDDHFTFAPPPGALKIDFVSLESKDAT